MRLFRGKNHHWIASSIRDDNFDWDKITGYLSEERTVAVKTELDIEKIKIALETYADGVSLAGKGILCPGFFFGAGIFSYGDFSKRGFIYMVSIVEKKLGKCYINSKRFY